MTLDLRTNSPSVGDDRTGKKVVVIAACNLPTADKINHERLLACAAAYYVLLVPDTCDIVIYWTERVVHDRLVPQLQFSLLCFVVLSGT